MEKIKNSLPIQIFIALGLGIVAGLIFLALGAAGFTEAYIKPFGTIFLNLLKFIVVPIVITSIIQGVVSLSDIKKVGTIGLRTIIYYFCTTAFAIVIGLIFSNIFKGTYKVLETSALEYEAAEPTSFMDTIVNIFPSNLFEPMVNNTMLQVIVIALFVGFGIIIAGDKGLPFKEWIDSAYEVFMVIMRGIIKMTPIAVFCLITPVVAVNGPEVLGSLAMVLLTAYIAYAVHALFTYSLAVKTLGHMNPVEFLKGDGRPQGCCQLHTSARCYYQHGWYRDLSGCLRDFHRKLLRNQSDTWPDGNYRSYSYTRLDRNSRNTWCGHDHACYGTPVCRPAGVDRIFDMGRTGINVVGDLSAAMIISDYETRREGKEFPKK